MPQSYSETHTLCLDAIVKNVSLIGEDESKLRWVGKEILYKDPSSLNFFPMCDLVLEFEDHAHLVEVKSYHGNMQKAASQLKYGRQWFKNYRHILWEPYLTILTYELTSNGTELCLRKHNLWRPPNN